MTTKGKPKWASSSRRRGEPLASTNDVVFCSGIATDRYPNAIGPRSLVQKPRMQAKDLLRELKRTVDELAAFNEIGKTMTSTLDIREVLKIIMQKVGELLQPESWSLLLVDEKARRALPRGLSGRWGPRAGNPEAVAERGWRRERRAPARTSGRRNRRLGGAREGEPVLVSDPRQDPRFSERLDGGPSLPERSILAVPLRVKGRTLGVIEVHSGRSEGDFSDGDVRTLASIADYAAIALENARNFQRLQELTVVDDHTGLYNSRHLQERLEAETRRARRASEAAYSIVFFSISIASRAVNDSYGHQHESALLREVGQGAPDDVALSRCSGALWRGRVRGPADRD